MKRPFPRKKNRGFALVVTLSLMILLTVVAVGLLSLSTITLRASSQGEAMARAKANARLALMQALGELQTTAGLDTRITATGAIMGNADPSKRNITGVWESWKFDPNAVPTTQQYSKTGEKNQKFKKWLVSSPKPDDTTQSSFANSAPAAVANRVTLVPTLKNGTTTIDPVYGNLVTVKNKLPGSYAFAVLDEGVKARMDTGFTPPSGGRTADLAAALATGARPDVSRIEGLEQVNWDASDLTKTGNQFHKTVSYTTGGLLLDTLGGSSSDRFPALYHDVTTSSLGLFTDAANGGLKQDLNSILNSSVLGTPYSGTNARMYSSHLGVSVASSSSTGQPEPSWAQIFNFANVYKTVTNKSGGPTLTMKPPTSWSTQLAPPPAFTTTATMMPSVLKVQMYYSLIAVPLALNGSMNTKPASNGEWTDPEGGLVGWASTAWDRGARYFMMICMAPVVTIHNPYNANLEIPAPGLSVEMTNVPMSIQINRQMAGGGQSGWVPANGQAVDNIDTESKERSKTGGRKFIFNLTSNNSPTFTLAPGEVRMFSATAPSNASYASNPYRSWNNFTDPTAAQPMVLESGFRGVTIGFYAPRVTANELTGYETYTYPPDAQGNTKRNSLEYLGPNDMVSARIRPCLDKRISSTDIQNGVTRVALVRTGSTSVSQQVYGLANIKLSTTKIEGNLLTGLEEALGASSAGQVVPPVAANTFGIATGAAPLNTLNAYTFAVATISAKTTFGNYQGKNDEGGMAAKPMAFHSDAAPYTMVDIDKSGLEPYAYEATAVPLDSASGIGFENYLDVNAGGRSRGISGHSTSRGMQFGTTYEVPTGPLRNITQLNSANLASTNSAARFTYPIGNSWASPSIAPDSITSVVTGLPVSYDHSFLLNSLLFDKYYLSGLAPRQGAFITAASTSNLAQAFLDGNTAGSTLDPRMVAYLPDGETETEALDTLSVPSNNSADEPQARTRAASHQLMKGAFNVNSTSKAAWKAMLSSLYAPDAKKFLINEGAVTPSVANLKSVSSKGARFSRFTLPNNDAPEVAADKQMVFQGPRDISDTELDNLAEKIVEQVRERGPFLSMWEFVNRQLGTSDLAQKGALQAAIDSTTINSNSSILSLTGYDIIAPSSKYLNPKAMEGRSDQGAPGYLSQADLIAVLGNAATVRSDTFTIRAYGDARDSANNITAKAWCEAVVQRLPEYVSPEDKSHVLPANLTSKANQTFGRRFSILSFRWIAPTELETKL